MTAAAARTVTPTDNQKPLITEAELVREFAHVDTALKEIEAKAADIPPVFEDDDDLTLAKDMAPKLRGAMKRIEEYRKQAKAPFDAGVAVVQSVFKAFDKRMNDLLTAHEKSATVYLRKKADREAERQREIEAEQRKEADRLAAQALEQAAAGKLTEAVATQAAAQTATQAAERASEMVDAKPAERARTATTAGTATLVDRWTFRIKDLTKIDGFKLQPYLTPAELDTVITRAVNAGVRDLGPGVEIFPDPKARL